MVKRNAEAELNLPPGFRFFPTDEELVVHYLYKKVNLQALPVPIIAEVDLYKYDPWQLPEKALFGEKEWYFFTPRERKYPNGSRPNRAAGTGYWKATGADKPIAAKAGKKRVGIKKALVFYAGKAPRGNKTNWIMHEYRVADPAKPARKKGSLRLDDWVLCRIYNKKSSAEKAAMEQQNPSVSMDHSGVEQSHLSSEQHHFRGADCQKENASVCVPAIDFQHPEVFHGVGGFAVNGPLRNSAQQQQILDFGGFQNQWPNYGSSAQILSGLQTDSSSTKPESPEFFSEKEEVESSLTADQKQQQQQQGFFGLSVEGLQNSFPAFDNGISIPDCYQDYMPSLPSSDYLPKFYASDLLFQ